MKNTNLEQTLLRTVRAGISNIDELTEELERQEQEQTVHNLKPKNKELSYE